MGIALIRSASTIAITKENNWSPKTLVCSALKNEGILELWKMISEYISLTKNNGYFDQKRKEQNKYWLLQTIESVLKSEFYNQANIKLELKKQFELLDKNKTTPFEAAEFLLHKNKSI